jgi:hypothetical protein
VVALLLAGAAVDWVVLGTGLWLALVLLAVPVAVPRLARPPRARIRRRVTTPPPALGILPAGVVATVVGQSAVSVAGGLYELAFGDWPGDDDVTRPLGLGFVAADLALLVVSSVLLRWLVRRWVAAQPPEPPRV